MSPVANLFLRQIANFSPAVINAAVRHLMRLGVVRHVGGKLIITQAGRYLPGTLGLKAAGLALSGPATVILGLLMLGYDVYKVVKA